MSYVPTWQSPFRHNLVPSWAVRPIFGLRPSTTFHPRARCPVQRMLRPRSLPLVARVPSTTNLCTLDEDEPLEKQCIGGYEVLEQLGAGMSGSTVFKAHMLTAPNEPEAEPVALKLLKAGFGDSDRFIREAEITCELAGHPNLTSGIEWGSAEGSHYLVMKLLKGQSLDEMLLGRGRMPWRGSTRLILHIARAVSHLHSNGIVHRDVKPSNIVIHEDIDPSTGNVRLTGVLIDLGLARRVRDSLADDDDDETSPKKSPTSPGSSPSGTPILMRRVKTPAYSAIGSPAFMAPEQVRDARACTAATDVYGLGAMWYAAVTGVLPFDGASPAKVMQQVLDGECVPPSARVAGLPPAVDLMIMWLLSKEPRRRPPCGDALIAEIEALLQAPDECERVRSWQEELAQKCEREETRLWLLQVVGWTVAAAVLAWLTWETMKLQPETGEVDESSVLNTFGSASL